MPATPIPIDLEGVEETQLIPLWARALETQRPDAFIHDERAVQMMQALDYDFSRFGRHQSAGTQTIAIAVRTELFDRAAQDFLARHPDATVINLGAGLDTRFFRLDNGRLRWFEVDLPRPMALRRQLIPESDRHRFVVGSVLEQDWLEAIPAKAGEPVLIIAEGLFMYLREADLRGLVQRLAERFPGAEMLFEALNPLALVGAQVVTRRHGLLGIKASLGWGLWSGRELEDWVPGLKWIEEWYYMDHHPERWGLMALGRFNPLIRTMLRIEHVRLPASAGSRRSRL